MNEKSKAFLECPENTPDTGIIVKCNGFFVFIKFQEIVIIKADGNCTNLLLKNQKHCLSVSKSIRKIDLQVNSSPGCTFIRCHKSYLVNLVEISSFSNKEKTICLFPYCVPISRRKALRIYKTLLLNGIVDKKTPAGCSIY